MKIFTITLAILLLTSSPALATLEEKDPYAELNKMLTEYQQAVVEVDHSKERQAELYRIFKDLQVKHCKEENSNE